MTCIQAHHTLNARHLGEGRIFGLRLENQPRRFHLAAHPDALGTFAASEAAGAEEQQQKARRRSRRPGRRPSARPERRPERHRPRPPGVGRRLRLVLDLGNGFGNDRGRPHHVFDADLMDYSGSRSGRRRRRRRRRRRWRRRQEGHQLRLGQGLGVNQRDQHQHADDDALQKYKRWEAWRASSRPSWPRCKSGR